MFITLLCGSTSRGLEKCKAKVSLILMEFACKSNVCNGLKKKEIHLLKLKYELQE